MKDTLMKLDDDFVLVPTDKATNNMIDVCKKYYIETLIKKLSINTTNISPTLHIFHQLTHLMKS